LITQYTIFAFYTIHIQHVLFKIEKWTGLKLNQKK